MSFQRKVLCTILIATVISFTKSLRPITILSDFTSDKDIKFYKQTLPWIVDNIGSDIRINYHFKDSGKDSGPRKCVLSQLTTNTYLQATFLSCEANGRLHSECIKSLPLNIRSLNACIRLRVNGFVKTADREFRRHKIDTTPALILPRKLIISNENPEEILKGICMLYPKNKPTGCVKPRPLPTENPNTENKIATEKASTEENTTTENPVVGEKDKSITNQTELPKEQGNNQENVSSDKNESPEQKKTSDKSDQSKENPTSTETPKEEPKSDNSQTSNENPKPK